MAKVTIVFEDAPDDVVDIRAEFDPPLGPDPDNDATPAQREAGAVVIALSEADDVISAQVTDSDGERRDF